MDIRTRRWVEVMMTTVPILLVLNIQRHLLLLEWSRLNKNICNNYHDKTYLLNILQLASYWWRGSVFPVWSLSPRVDKCLGASPLVSSICLLCQRTIGRNVRAKTGSLLQSSCWVDQRTVCFSVEGHPTFCRCRRVWSSPRRIDLPSKEMGRRDLTYSLDWLIPVLWTVQ